MADTPPSSIAAPFKGVTAEGEENSRQRQAARDVVDNQTVGVYDPRDNTILQAPARDAEHYRNLGLVVGDEEAEHKQIYNSAPAMLDAFSHHAANTVTLNTFDNLAALTGNKDYLQEQQDIDAENPYSALAGDLVGGLASSPVRSGSALHMGLAAYEGGTAAMTNAYTLDEPITAERVVMGAGMGLAYNALFNYGPGLAAKGARGAGKGLHALNEKVGWFIKEGEEAARPPPRPRPLPRSRPVTPEPGPSPGPIPSEPSPRSPQSPAQPQSAADRMEEALRNRPQGPPEPAASPDAPPDIPPAPPMQPEPHNTPEPLPEGPLPSDHELLDYGDAKTNKEKTALWRRAFNELLDTNSDAHKLDSIFHGYGAAGGRAKAAGDLEKAAEHFELKRQVGKQLDGLLPRGIDPKTGDFKPGYHDYLREYGRLGGNRTSLLLDAKYRPASPAEAAAIAHEATLHPDSAPEVVGETPKEKVLDPKEIPLPTTSPSGRVNAPEGESELLRKKAAELRDKMDGLSKAKAEPAKPQEIDASSFTPRRAETAQDVKNKWTDSINRLTEIKNKAVILGEHGSEAERAKLGAEYSEAKAAHKVNAAQKGVVESTAKRMRVVNEQIRDAQYYLDRDLRHGLYTPEQLQERVVKYSAELDELEKTQQAALGQKSKVDTSNHLKLIKELEKGIQDAVRKGPEKGVSPELHKNTIEKFQALLRRYQNELEEYGPREKQYANAQTTPPGEINKVSDIDGRTTQEAQTDHVTQQSQQAGAYAIGKDAAPSAPGWRSKIRRSTLWHAHFYTPHVMRPLLAMAQVINEIGPFVLNNTDRFAQHVQNMAEASSRGTAGAIKRAISGTVGRRAAISGQVDPFAEFQRNRATVLAAQASPGSLEAGIRRILGPDAEKHPELVSNVIATTGRQIQAMSDGMPRNVQAPTPRGDDFTPPRSVMVRWNRHCRAVADPGFAIAHPDPDTWAAVIAAHPETAKYVQDTLLSVVANPKIKLNKQQARNVSVLVQGAVTPQNQPDYLKSLHDGATMQQAPNPPGKPSSSGGHSAKTAQQVATLDATPEIQAQLGN